MSYDRPAPPMVYGARKAVVKGLLWGRIAWLSLRLHRRPWRAARAVRRLVAERARHRRQVTAKYARAGGRFFWDLYAPGWPSLAFDRFVERELARAMSSPGPPALQTLIFAITKSCPLRCQHCCEWDSLNHRETLSRADLMRIVSRFQERGVAQILLSGGEPLQRTEDIIDLVTSAGGESDFWILTSGHGLSEERAVRLGAAGLTGVVLSLDHWDAAEHDRFRGFPGAHAQVERAARHARAAGLLLGLSLCPTRAFVSEENLQRYAELARGLGAGFIQILEPKAVGHYAGKDVELGPAQLELLEAFYLRLNFDRACRNMPAVQYVALRQRRTGCSGAGDRYLYVDTDGALLACPFCRAPRGNALEGRLDDALQALGALGCPEEADAGVRPGAEEVSHGG